MIVGCGGMFVRLISDVKWMGRLIHSSDFNVTFKHDLLRAHIASPVKEAKTRNVRRKLFDGPGDDSAAGVSPWSISERLGAVKRCAAQASAVAAQAQLQ